MRPIQSSLSTQSMTARRASGEKGGGRVTRGVGVRLDLQVDGEQLEGDAQVAPEGQALPHMHHTATPITVLHIHIHHQTSADVPR